MNFHDNPSSGGRASPCGHTDRQSMTKLIVVIRSFANACKNIVHRAKKSIVFSQCYIKIIFISRIHCVS